MKLLNLINFTSKFRFIKSTIKTHFKIVILFTILYYVTNLILNNKGFDHIKYEKKNMSLIDCFRFSLFTQTTVGYGEIFPIHDFIKIINILQLFTIFGVLILEI
jgi:hypothetical protein